jgi:hypothetical protein
MFHQQHTRFNTTEFFSNETRRKNGRWCSDEVKLWSSTLCAFFSMRKLFQYKTQSQQGIEFNFIWTIARAVYNPGIVRQSEISPVLLVPMAQSGESIYLAIIQEFQKSCLGLATIMV